MPKRRPRPLTPSLLNDYIAKNGRETNLENVLAREGGLDGCPPVVEICCKHDPHAPVSVYTDRGGTFLRCGQCRRCLCTTQDLDYAIDLIVWGEEGD